MRNTQILQRVKGQSDFYWKNINARYIKEHLGRWVIFVDCDELPEKSYATRSEARKAFVEATGLKKGYLLRKVEDPATAKKIVLSWPRAYLV